MIFPHCIQPLTLIPGGYAGRLKRYEIFFIARIFFHQDEDDEKVDANLAKKPKPACLWWTLEEIVSTNSKFILGWLIGLPLSGSIQTSSKGSKSKRGSWLLPCSDHSRCMIQSHAGSQNCMVQVELRIPKFYMLFLLSMSLCPALKASLSSAGHWGFATKFMYDATVTRCQAMWTGMCTIRAISYALKFDLGFRFCLIHN